MLSLTKIPRDVIMEFVTGPSPLYLERDKVLSSRLSVLSLTSLKEIMMERCLGEEFQWVRGAEKDGMPSNENQADSVVYIIKTQWMYAFLQASEFKRPVSAFGNIFILLYILTFKLVTYLNLFKNIIGGKTTIDITCSSQLTT